MTARRSLTLAASAGALLLALAGCAAAGSSGSQPSTPASLTQATTPPACAPVAGDAIVVLADDKGLQTVDNIIPAINTKAASPAMIALLDKASAAIDTPTLVSLNRSVDVDRKTSSEVAKTFVADKGLAAASPSGSGSIVVGAGNFSEASTLAEIYAAVLRSGGYTVNVQTIGNRETYLSALVSGQLTIVPEYVGTLTEFLNKQANGANVAAQASSDLNATVTALTALGKTAGLTFGKSSAAQDQNAFAVTKAFADKHKVTTLTELAATCSGIVLGGPPECPTRPFCQPGLTGKYGLRIADFKSLDAGGPLTKTALQKGDIALGLVFSSDGSLGG
jgi:osmoprotectant transport system substrate-binding protein